MKRTFGVQDLPHGILVAEVLPRDGFGQHHLVVAIQRRPGIARQKGHIEDVEDRTVGQIERSLVEPLVAVLDHPGVTRGHETDHVFHFGKVGPDELGYRDQHIGVLRDLVPLPMFGGHAEYTVRLVVEPVVAQLVADVEQDEKTASDPERQAHDVDERVALLAIQVAESHRKIVAEHGNLSSGP